MRSQFKENVTDNADLVSLKGFGSCNLVIDAIVTTDASDWQVRNLASITEIEFVEKHSKNDAVLMSKFRHWIEDYELSDKFENESKQIVCSLSVIVLVAMSFVQTVLLLSCLLIFQCNIKSNYSQLQMPLSVIVVLCRNVVISNL